MCIRDSYHVQRGAAKAALAKAEVVVEGTYETGAQEQLYIETQGVVAIAAPGKGVTVWGSMQCPYYVHKALGPVLGLPPEQVRVVQTVTGGGFGGKEEYPNVIAGHAALLSWKAGGRPVKLVYDRLEDMWATTKRHPSRTTIRAGFTRDGKLTGLGIAVDLDGGAYVTLTPVVLSRGTLHAGGAYACDDVSIESRAACRVPRERTTGVSVTYAPQSMSIVIPSAVSLPPLVKPARIEVRLGWRFVVAHMSSSRS